VIGVVATLAAILLMTTSAALGYYAGQRSSNVRRILGQAYRAGYRNGANSIEKGTHEQH
jgi:hypothetical protein